MTHQTTSLQTSKNYMGHDRHCDGY